MKTYEGVETFGYTLIWKTGANIFKKSSRGQPKRNGSPAWGLDEGLTTSHRKKKNLLRNITEPRTWTGSGQGPVAGPCEHSNETLGSIKDGKFLN